MRIPSKENRSFKDDLDRVACRPRFGAGITCVWHFVFPLLGFQMLRTGSVEELAPLLASTRGATASTSSARAPGKRLFFSNLDFDLGCGKSRTRRSRPCAPIVTRSTPPRGQRRILRRSSASHNKTRTASKQNWPKCAANAAKLPKRLYKPNFNFFNIFPRYFGACEKQNMLQVVSKQHGQQGMF